MSFKNVSIKKRIFLSNISMILIPLLIMSIASPFFFSFLEKYMDFDTVTTNTYSAINQIQWNVSIDEITGQIKKTDNISSNQKLIKNLKSLEEYGSNIIITENGKPVYITEGITRQQFSQKSLDVLGRDLPEDDIFYYGNNGLFISCNFSGEDTSKQYRFSVVNSSYQTNYDAQNQNSPVRDTYSFFAGKFGIVIVAIILVFALSILLLTFITATGITRPLTKLKQGTNHIRHGDYDYEIDYKSTNEFGQLVDDFNEMRTTLKETIEKKEKLETQRKEMIAGFSHDLRTPLTSIKGYTQGLIDGIANTPEKQKKYLKTIYTTACDMENLVSELFLFSKLEIDKVTLEKENVTIVNFLSDCCEEQELELQKLDMSISFSYSCDKMTIVSIDTAKFSRVILNIISNSIKYRKPGETGHIKIHLSKNQQYVLISIEDNGIGIDDENARHIFETFYRADQARSNVHDGSGLGLSICKQIIDLHDGNIWATGKPDVGTVIHIALPLPKIKE